jgi:hypothetical protein
MAVHLPSEEGKQASKQASKKETQESGRVVRH